MSNNERILQSLLAQQNEVLAKISVCHSAGWDVPDSLYEYSEQLKAEIDRVKIEIEKEAQR